MTKSKLTIPLEVEQLVGEPSPALMLQLAALLRSDCFFCLRGGRVCRG